MTKWVPNEKPPPDVCPEEFCFHYAPGGFIVDLTGNRYRNREEALKAIFVVGTQFEEAGCACYFGRCLRDPRGGGEKDYYEPHEPNLRRAGLPKIYFISSEQHIHEKYREEYRREAVKLWGENKAPLDSGESA
jgi:hypothetical protein